MARLNLATRRTKKRKQYASLVLLWLENLNVIDLFFQIICHILKYHKEKYSLEKSYSLTKHTYWRINYVNGLIRESAVDCGKILLAIAICFLHHSTPNSQHPNPSPTPLLSLSHRATMPAADVGDPILAKDRAETEMPTLLKLNRWQWWLLAGLNIFFLVAGQTAAVLLGRFYYDKGGNSTFMATLLQTAGFPILFIPLLFLPSSPSSSTPSSSIPAKYICLIYIALGILLAADNFLYSLGLLYLSASTYSLICATQLAFNAVFAFFINSHKFTPLILNSVVILSFSAALLGVNETSDKPAGVTKSQYAIGFICTLGASAIYSLLLSLMQLTFQKALKKETFSVVLEVQIYTSIVASLASVVALFVSGQWRSLGGEMHDFHTGKVSYVMTLFWTAVCWQVCSVGVVGLIFMVSSLFSNVISTVALAVAPIASVIAFHDPMNGVKIIAMLQALWGFASYIYQNYLDESRLTRSRREMEANETTGVASC